MTFVKAIYLFLKMLKLCIMARKVYCTQDMGNQLILKIVNL